MIARHARHLATLVFALCAAASATTFANERESLIDPNQYRGLAADHRAYRVGDIVTIYVLEATRAKSQAATEAGSDLNLDVGLSSPSTQYNANLGLSGNNASGAQTTRVGELRTQVSAQVTAVEINGSLRIAGEQSLIVNGERQKIRITGLIRPEDINADNTVWSNRIANADLELLGVGVVSESQRQSIFYRVFKWLRLL
ncbi:MAG: flagellar basal body L-ring protein FlgH [Lysobacteraceae bacterium]